MCWLFIYVDRTIDGVLWNSNKRGNKKESIKEIKTVEHGFILVKVYRYDNVKYFEE